MRFDGRAVDKLRRITITPNFIKQAEGSALVEFGHTKVICTASIEEKVPPFLKGRGTGWVTAEYGMIPRATETRVTRDSTRGYPSGRTQEIQRLIGRSIRSVVAMSKMGERTIYLDCDVIQADGGTRTASITGAFVACSLALKHLKEQKKIYQPLTTEYLAAISVGIIKGVPMLDLNYKEDSQADVDLNVVCTGNGHFVEVQGTAEHKPFTQEQMDLMLTLAKQGIEKLVNYQKDILGELA